MVESRPSHASDDLARRLDEVRGAKEAAVRELEAKHARAAEGHAADEALSQALQDHCREHLAGYKVPRSVDFEASLPRHPTGKLYKRLLRDRYWEGRKSRI